MKVNYTLQQSVKYQILTEAQCAEIAGAAYRILARTGCIVQNQKALTLLKEAGCVVDGEHVWIPETLTRWAVETAPKSITLYDREGNFAFRLDPNSFHFGPVTNTCDILDLRTGERRSSTKKDLEECAILLDALDNISWNSDICTLNDVDQTYADVEEVCTLLQNTRKPFWYFASSMENLEAQYEMFKAVAGGAETLRIRPFTINLVCPLDALRHSDHGVSQLIYCAERGLPVVYIPGTEFGLTSPATMAGTLAAGIADLLPAVVISQLVNKGAPIIAACFRNNVDFRTMKLNHSRPEMITANCATAEVWRYMGLPFCCNMANTGNGDFGPLSAFEKTIQYYSVMLSGINMCYGLGCYEEGMLLRPSDLIFANEVIGYLETLVKGFPVDQDTLAEDLIDEVGPGGTYLMEEHTMEHLYSFWTPDKLAPRKLGEGVSLEQDLAEAALAIIEKGPRHPLSPGKQQAIDALMEKVRARSKK